MLGSFIIDAENLKPQSYISSSMILKFKECSWIFIFISFENSSGLYYISLF